MERLQGVTSLDSIKNPKLQEIVLATVNNLLHKGLFTKEAYNQVKYFFVGRGESVEIYCDERIAKGELKWHKECLVENLSHVELTFNIDEEEALRKIVIQTNLQPTIIIQNLLHRTLFYDFDDNNPRGKLSTPKILSREGGEENG